VNMRVCVCLVMGVGVCVYVCVWVCVCVCVCASVFFSQIIIRITSLVQPSSETDIPPSLSSLCRLRRLFFTAWNCFLISFHANCFHTGILTPV